MKNTERAARNAVNRIGKGAFECIKQMVDALELGDASIEIDAYEAAREAIEQDPLSIEVRAPWRAIGDPDDTPDEFRILLSTGGPATRIVGELCDGEPSSARLEVQDWGLPWTEYTQADEEVLLTYCRVFCWEQ